MEQQQQQEQISPEAPTETPSLQSGQESLLLTSEPTSGTSPVPPVTSGMQIYENATLGFSIQHPSKSSVTERGDIVAFSLPEPSSYLLVRVSNLTTPGMSLENYSSVTINALNESRSGFSIEQQFNYSMLAGNPAHNIIYMENQTDSQRKTLQTWTITDDKAYDLTYVSDISNFDTGMPRGSAND